MTLLRAALPGDDKYQTLCHGEKVKNFKSPFLRGWNVNGGDYDYASLLTPQEIETRLKDYYNLNGGGVLHTISKLQNHHPDFQTDIGYRIASIVIDIAKKRPLGKAYHNNGIYKVLLSMPHESMSLYVEDLFEIVKRETDAIGCIDFVCTEAIRGQKAVLWKLAQIFNGGGAEAAPYLDKLVEANQQAVTGNKAYWKPIGGIRQASSCIGHMSPKMEKLFSAGLGNRQGTPYARDNHFYFHWQNALRMTSQGDKAYDYIKHQYKWMQRKISDGTMKPSWAKTKGLEKSIKRTEKTLEEWIDQKPYCPTRDTPGVTW